MKFTRKPVRRIPDILMKNDSRSVEAYRSILKTGSETLNTVCVNIVGTKNSGKTSLTKRLLKDQSPFRKTYNKWLCIHSLKAQANIRSRKWNFPEGKKVASFCTYGTFKNLFVFKRYLGKTYAFYGNFYI